MKAQPLETGSNILPTAQYFDESFSLQHTSEGILLVHIGKRSLTYSVFDKVMGTFQGIASYQATDGQSDLDFHQDTLGLMAKEAVFKADYSRIAIAVQAETHTLVAEDLFDEKNKAPYLQFDLSNPESEDIFADKIENAKAYSVYSLQRNLIQLLDKLFPAPKVIDADVPYINGLLHEFQREKDNCLFLNMGENQLSLLAMQKGKLALFNTYNIAKETDVLYFALAVCEQLGFNPNYVKVHLLGSIEADDACHKILKEHFTHVQFGQRPKAYKYAEVLNKAPQHQFYPVFSLLSCVS